jgi:plasmid stabilization system protein ParE
MAQEVIIWTAPALEDLDEIADYIALDNVGAAARLVEKIFAATDRLAQFPNLGRKVPELPNLPYRELIISPCRVIYRVEQERVFIAMVTRGERLMEEHRLWRWNEN